MRRLPVLTLAVLVALSPAAQAFGCVCAAGEGLADSARDCCCGGEERPCPCCPNQDREDADMVRTCACSTPSPQVSQPETEPLSPAPVMAILPDAGGAVAPAKVAVATLVRTDPHPEIVLPLLI